MKTKIGYVVCGLLILVACFYPFYNVDRDVAMSDVTRIIEEYATNSSLKKEDKKYIRKHYKLEEQDYQDMILYVRNSLMEADEFAVIKEEDKTKRSFIKQQMEQRMRNKLKSFEGYGAQQSALIKAGYVFEKGNYVILVVNQKASEFKKEVEALF